MRNLTVAFLLLACACQGAEQPAAKNSASAAAVEPVTLTAADGVKVYGTFYPARNPKALILLFHQAGSSRAEYASIAPKLAAAGYSALAIDQRAGGELFGPNATVKGLGHSADYLAAKQDLEAALAWAKTRKLPIILWGSSYSASLVFMVAAEHPGEVAAVMAFSPGEYFDDKDAVHRAASKVAVPVFVTSAKDPQEIEAARSILNASPSRLKVDYVPEKAGVHGSSTLIAVKDPAGAGEAWAAVMRFLRQIA